MRILLVRLSSMGDIIQTLPAISDAAKQFPEAEFDWVIDESFADIAHWHQRINRVIPCYHRRWGRDFKSAFSSHSVLKFIKELRRQRYDYVIDVQTALKTAIVTRLAKGLRCGYVKSAVFEKGAQFAYQRRYNVPKGENSLFRMRKALAQALGYTVDAYALPDYGIAMERLQPLDGFVVLSPYIVFVHCASWATKGWHEMYWQQLIQTAVQQGLNIVLPWGSQAELQRAKRLAANHSQVFVLPKSNLSQKAWVIAKAKALIGVDTGLSHLAAALGVPAITLFGPTDANLCGTVGQQQIHLSSNFSCLHCHQGSCHFDKLRSANPPCFDGLTPEMVWRELGQIVN